MSACSTNWSGWADNVSSGGFTGVLGSFTVPSLTCPKHGTTYVALWVGIDGFTSTTVEQTGVLGVCNDGVASYSTWYEFYPSPMVTTTVGVQPGNIVSASVIYSSSTNEFTVTIANTYTGTSATATQAVAGAARSSAEWVIERPALCNGAVCKLSTLADFGNASFTSSSVTIGIAQSSIAATSTSPFTDAAMTMVGSSTGPILAEPSSLSTDGTSFSVMYV